MSVLLNQNDKKQQRKDNMARYDTTYRTLKAQLFEINNALHAITQTCSSPNFKTKNVKFSLRYSDKTKLAINDEPTSTFQPTPTTPSINA